MLNDTRGEAVHLTCLTLSCLSRGGGRHRNPRRCGGEMGGGVGEGGEGAHAKCYTAIPSMILHSDEQ